ncbi:hypothetical protein K469DRAFT_693029 [Zopfia rhizophila CBS 207.26]|uniref:Carrier domain-containing protein n=1 Tax=Zopfia rhizophila CBS 207.26 TaxID=1314779 RepID=A0A6A6EQF3_9PEZI|nr:hypothetical protein K469DRAFT_693029 [Zopfia rhizophila CBS 207.26]
MDPPILDGDTFESYTGCECSRRRNNSSTEYSKDADPDGGLIEPIAIVGFDFTFPGDATSEERFWNMLIHAGVNTPKVPEDRFNAENLQYSNAGFPGGHFLEDDIARFDAPFFSISPAEAAAMDPQQRRLLETTYRALENGMLPHRLPDLTTTINSKDPELMPTYHATGNSGAILSNRISWFFDLRGPSITIDTACSSSLIALHYACDALRHHQTTMGIVGGCNVLCAPELTMSIGAMGFLSPDGLCHSFDEQGCGYARAEGFGVIIIKRLSDALKNRDTIRAVIRATGANQDGRTVGLSQPNPVAQENLLRTTYKSAGLDLSRTRFVEAHGTGTSVGDPIEAEALTKAFKGIRDHVTPVYIGATKANIGHLGAASGIAGIIKTILVLEKAIIPPIAQLKQLNSRIRGSSNLAFPTACVPWPTDGLRRASIQSFGFGGTNAHVVLDDTYNFLRLHNLVGNHVTAASPPSSECLRYLLAGKKQEISLPNGIVSGSAKPSLPKLLVWSSADKYGLTRITRSYEELFRQGSLLWKSFAIVNSVSDLSQLSDLIQPPKHSLSNRNLGLVFTGRGAQWMGMGQDLLIYEVFHMSLIQSETYLKEFGCKWSLLNFIWGSSKSDINDAEYSQPICTALQIALIDLLRSFEVLPRAVVGHSSGEIAAAYCIGALSHHSAMTVAYHRGVLSDQLAKEGTPQGGMMTAGISTQAIATYLDKVATRFGSLQVTVGCVNSPTNVTLSGDKTQLTAIKLLLEEDKIPNRILKVPVAYHSSQMKRIALEYENRIHKITKRSSTYNDITMISSVTGKQVSPDILCRPEYWATNLTSTVLFSSALSQLCTSTFELHSLLEIGPHSTLQGPIRDTLKALPAAISEMSYHSLVIRFQPSVPTLMKAIGELHTLGHNLSIINVNSSHQPCQGYFMTLSNLPLYPFDHSKAYWAESRLSKDFKFRKYTPHAVLGSPVSDWNPFEPRWRLIARLAELPFIEDHRVNGTIAYPAAAMVAAVVEGGRQLSEERVVRGYEIRNITFTTPLIFSSNSSEIEIELRFRKVGSDGTDANESEYEFRLYSFSDERSNLHSQGSICIEYKSTDTKGFGRGYEAEQKYQKAVDDYERILQNSNKTLDTAVLYHQLFTSLGYQYGPTFQLLQDLSCDGNNRAAARLTPPPGRIKHRAKILSPHVIHPAALDAVLQTTLVAASKGGNAPIPTLVPEHIQRLWISSTGLALPATKEICIFSHSALKTFRKMEATVTVFSSTKNKLLVDIEGFIATSVSANINGPQKSELVASGLCYRMEWKPDVDLMGPEQILAHCWEPIKLEISERELKDFENDVIVLVFHSMFRAIERIEAGEITLAREYMTKYVRWMKLQADKFHRGEYPETQSRYMEIAEDESQLARLHDRADANKRWRFYAAVADNLVDVLSGEMDPLNLLFGQGYATDYYSDTVDHARCGHAVQRYLSLLAHKKPNLRILEIGAGTGSTTSRALKGLMVDDAHGKLDRFSRYDFTDISPSLLATAQETFGPYHPNMRFRVFDVEKSSEEQGFANGSYDVVIAAGVLHATARLEETVRNVRSLLKEGGKVLLGETVKPERVAIGFGFGLLPGWWLGTEDYRQTSPCVSKNLWDDILKRSGFSGVDVDFKDFVLEECHENSTLVSTAVSEKPRSSPLPHNDWPIIVTNLSSSEDLDLANRIGSRLHRQLGLGCVVGSMKGISSSSAVGGKRCIVLDGHQRSFLPPVSEESFLATRSLISSASDILWVTGGGGERPSSPGYGLIQGLARTARRENNRLRIVAVALESASSKDRHADNIVKVFEQMQQRSSTNNYEPEYIEMSGALHINRILESHQLNSEIEQRLSGQITGRRRFGDGVPLILRTGGDATGLHNLHFEEDVDVDLPFAHDEIEIEVKAIGCDTMDGLAASGRLDNDFIGFEVSGIVTRVGSRCWKFKEGDLVVAFAVNAYRTLVRTKECLAAPLPSNFSLVQGASLPMNFGTAFLALVDIAHLEAGESILIHSAAGEMGQAAVEIARHIGSYILATVGSEEEKDFLIARYGLSPQRIFYSVDVVVNCLSGDFLEASGQCVAPYGHLIQIAEKHVDEQARIDIAPLVKNVSIAVVSVAAMIRDRPVTIGKVLRKIVNMAEQGVIRAPETTVNGISNVNNALGHLLSGSCYRKVVIEVNREEVVQAVTRIRKTSFDSNATYVIAGLGGLGRSVARWMAGRGAKYLLLLSRSGAKCDDSRRLVDELKEGGAHVETPACNVANGKELSAVLMAYGCNFPVIRGCIQASMVLKDSVFENMSYTDFNTALDPKVKGSWNLHNLLPSSLDFFIMLSSVAGIFGSGGQANYAAGNTYQDALARYRLSHGQKATSIDLGSIIEEGYMARNPEALDGLFRSDGVSPMSQEILFELLDYYCNPGLENAPGQLITGLATPAKMRALGIHEPWWTGQPLFNALHMIHSSENIPSSTLNAYVEKAVDFQNVLRSDIASEDLIGLIMKALILRLRIMPTSFEDDKVTEALAKQPIHSLGVDSLVAVELRNWFAKEMAADVATFEILGGMGMKELSRLVVERSGLRVRACD